MTDENKMKPMTNKFNFPDYVYRYCTHDSYDYNPETISATTLLQPARIFALKNKHRGEIEMDITDVIAARYGTAIHDSIERIDLPNCEQETRLSYKIAGATVTGKFDIMADMDKEVRKIVDVKSTSVWAWIFDSKDKSYTEQLSIYKFLGNKNGYRVGKDAEIWMVFTDWSRAKAKADPNYPQHRMAIKKITLWDDDVTEKFITERVKELTGTIELSDSQLPKCTETDLWSTQTKYAVMKKGGKRAVKLFDDLEDAEFYKIHKFNEKERENIYIAKRPGKAKRCNYCVCNRFCEQYNQMVADDLVDRA